MPVVLLAEPVPGGAISGLHPAKKIRSVLHRLEPVCDGPKLVVGHAPPEQEHLHILKGHVVQEEVGVLEEADALHALEGACDDDVDVVHHAGAVRRWAR